MHIYTKHIYTLFTGVWMGWSKWIGKYALSWWFSVASVFGVYHAFVVLHWIWDTGRQERVLHIQREKKKNNTKQMDGWLVVKSLCAYKWFKWTVCLLYSVMCSSLSGNRLFSHHIFIAWPNRKISANTHQAQVHLFIRSFVHSFRLTMVL